MNTFLQNIGRCLILCQQIEVIVGTMLFLERRDKMNGIESIFEAFSQVRVNVLESMKNELRDKKVTYVDFTELEAVIVKRNWLVHRMSFESRFVRASVTCDDDYSDVLEFFESASKSLSEALQKRKEELGIKKPNLSDGEAMKALESFTDLISMKSSEILKSRKSKRRKG